MASPNWNSTIGAATWGSGTSGVSGIVSSSNSLVGTSSGDQVGFGGITALSNGNYVVDSYDWNSSTGAVTWGSGTAGVSGAVSSSNSLVGSNAGDYVGGFLVSNWFGSPSYASSVTALSSGNYVVVSPNWNSNTGAATWGSGTSGVSGTISSSNSLVGSSSGDQVGSVTSYVNPGFYANYLLGITVLSNGNYVVTSGNWNNGTGAATWGSGTSGVTGTISSSNSLVGSSSGDYAGFSSVLSYATCCGQGFAAKNGVTALANGNYVVVSSYWDGTLGAATWVNGSNGHTSNGINAISSANSLVGSNSGDEIGFNGVAALTNGNYVVLTPNWDGGNGNGLGAATWVDGTNGQTSNDNNTISSSNSLVGSNSGDEVGIAAVALTNGNYVVKSGSWHGSIGAATWGSGTSGVSGVVSSSNSLVGSNTYDFVGANIIALTNGNYVMYDSDWNSFIGAVTWGSGTSGVTGVVSSANSLVGSNPNDSVGAAVVALPNGNYVVASPQWNNNHGAVTWVNGSNGQTSNGINTISSSNSLIGSNFNDNVGGSGVVVLSNGNYVVASPEWNSNTGAATWGNEASGVTGVVSSSNSLVGSSSGDQTGNSITLLSNGNYVVNSPNWDSNLGAATFGSGTAGVTGTISTANSIIGSAAHTDLGTITEDTAEDTFIVPFTTSGVIYVAPTSMSPNTLTYGFLPGADFTVDTSYLASVLGGGTNVTLQANNDITVSNAVTVTGGTPGNLALDAGHSILLNANITTNGGNLSLLANDTAANGIVDADRDTGAAAITMASGTTLDTGTGALSITIGTGAGNTNTTSGDIMLYGITAGALTVANNGPSNGNVTFNDALILGGNSSVTTDGGNSSVTTDGGNVTFASTVGGGYDLTATAGTFSFGSAWGSGAPLGNVSLTSANALSLPAVSAASIFAQTTGATSDLTLAGQLIASANNTAVTLASAQLHQQRRKRRSQRHRPYQWRQPAMADLFHKPGGQHAQRPDRGLPPLFLHLRRLLPQPRQRQRDALHPVAHHHGDRRRHQRHLWQHRLLHRQLCRLRRRRRCRHGALRLPIAHHQRHHQRLRKLRLQRYPVDNHRRRRVAHQSVGLPARLCQRHVDREPESLDHHWPVRYRQDLRRDDLRQHRRHGVPLRQGQRRYRQPEQRHGQLRRPQCRHGQDGEFQRLFDQRRGRRQLQP